MAADGKWGGNLEIQALSMRFVVNFYIHIYDHPMYIVRNFDNPVKTIHLSYHDGNHYNSVRLKDDFANEIPIPIPDEVLAGVSQTSDLTTLQQIEEKNNDLVDSEDELSETEKEYRKIEEEKKKYMEKDEEPASKAGQLTYKGIAIKDTDEKKKKRKYIRKLLTKEGQFLFEVGDDKKCHCMSNKKYRNCCKAEDIMGDYDKDSEEFFCDVERFLMFYSTLPEEKNEKKNGRKNSSDKEEEKEKEKDKESVTVIEKKMAAIHI